MGIFNFFKPKSKSQGSIIVKPSEVSDAIELAKKEGVSVDVPETGTTYSPSTGFQPQSVPSGWTSGGGGGGSSPAPTPTTQTPAQATAEYAQEVAQLRTEAQAKGVPLQVYATQQRAQQAEQIRALALKENRNIETPVRERQFIYDIRQRQQQERIVQSKQQAEAKASEDFINQMEGRQQSIKPTETKFQRGVRLIQEDKERTAELREQEALTHFGQLSLPAKVRQTPIRLGKFVFGDIGGSIKGKKGEVVGRKVGGFVGETALYMGLLSPASTTAQIETSIGSLTKSVYGGVTQRVGKDIHLTRIGFISERGKQVEKGAVVVLSKLKPIEDKLLSVSVFKGATYKRGINVPTTKEIIKDSRAFEGVDFSFIKQVGDKFKSVSAGRVRDKLLDTKFVGASVGETRKGFTRILGITKTEGGDVLSAGLIKKLLTPPKVKGFTGGIRGSKGTSLSNVELKQITSAVKSSIPPIKQPTTTLTRLPSILPLVSATTARTITPSAYAGTGLYERTDSYGIAPQMMSTPSLQVMQPLSLSRMDLNLFIKTDTQVKTQMKELIKTKIQTKQKQKIAEQMKQPIKIKSQLRIKSAISPAQQTRQVLRTRNIFSSIFPRITPKRVTEVIPRIPTFKPTKQQRQPQSFNVLMRRFGKFKSIGTARDLQKALALGTKKARGTLGVTIKIEGANLKGLQIPKDFYKKITPQGTLLIEKRGRRLKKGTGEIPEIQYWKKIKRRKNK